MNAAFVQLNSCEHSYKTLCKYLGARSGGKFVVSRAGEAYDAQARSLNPKFRLKVLGGDLWPYLIVEVF
jgi:hypothetical protein